MGAKTKSGNKTALSIGPFSGGMNTYSDPASLADNELVSCVNFDVALDGTLVSRPPIQSINNGAAIGFTQRIYLIGTATISGVTYVFGSNANGVFRWDTGAWTLITNTVICSSAVQYNNVVYFLPFPNNPSFALGKWTPSGGYSDVSPANLKTMMGGTNLGGGSLVIYKDRLFILPGYSKIGNESRLIFSDPGNPEGYSATTQFVDINPGDGQRLMDAVVQDDNLMCFKSESTWVFTFTSSPADAEVVKINPIIGVNGLRCIESFENAIYILHRGRVYEIVNYNFQCINIQCPFEFDGSTPAGSVRFEGAFINRIGDRLFVRWANRTYVYGLRTKAWTRWESANASLNNIGPLIHYVSPSEDYYLAGSCLDNDFHLFKILDAYTTTINEKLDSTDVNINCYIITKNFDLGDPFHYKRLHWWGVDAVVKNDITGTVSTVVALFSPTWQDIQDKGTIWNDFGTWGQSASNTLDQTTIPVSTSNILRSYFRFPRSVRFRQSLYTVLTTTSGTSLTGPVRIFGITLVASSKELVPKGSN